MAYTTYAYLHISDQRFDILRNGIRFLESHGESNNIFDSLRGFL